MYFCSLNGRWELGKLKRPHEASSAVLEHECLSAGEEFTAQIFKIEQQDGNIIYYPNALTRLQEYDRIYFGCEADPEGTKAAAFAAKVGGKVEDAFFKWCVVRVPGYTVG